VALPDEIRERAAGAYKALCTACGCANKGELIEVLAVKAKPSVCPIARILRACGQLGTKIILPRALTEAVRSREASWQALRTYLRDRVAGGPLAADFAVVEGAWSVMRKQLRKRGIKFPSQLVWGVHETHPVCLLPTTIARDPQWLSPLRLVLTQVNLRDLFPRVDRGARPAPVPSLYIRSWFTR
jgi:hypothetical protein